MSDALCNAKGDHLRETEGIFSASTRCNINMLTLRWANMQLGEVNRVNEILDQ